VPPARRAAPALGGGACIDERFVVKVTPPECRLVLESHFRYHRSTVVAAAPDRAAAVAAPVALPGAEIYTEPARRRYG